MTGSEILQLELNSIKADLIARHQMLGMKSSGRWIDSVEVKVSGSSGKILANDYTQQLVNGREPGRFPPVQEIERWIYEKGIQPINNNMKVSTLAFLIARKISREGTEYFKQGGTDLVDAVITPERIQSIIDKVSEFHISLVVSEITGVFQKLAA